jgi:hypothetical protein
MSKYTEPGVILINEVRYAFEDSIGKRVPNKSRKIEHVQSRMAISNAVRPYATLKNIGLLFDKDHSSIHHYIKEHEAMLLYSECYVKKFGEAMRLTHEVARELRVCSIYSSLSKNGREQSLHDHLKNTDKVITNMSKLRKEILKQIDDEFESVE